MKTNAHRNLVYDTIDEISRLTALPEIPAAFAAAASKFGFDWFGFNALPPPGQGADPIILTERTPEGFRGSYVEERFYLVDHLCAHGRTAYQPFRYSEAPSARTPEHRRFMQVLGLEIRGCKPWHGQKTADDGNRRCSCVPG